MAEPIVLAEGLHKRFGDVHALRGLDLAVPPGTVCGLLGPNGAGKTTAVRILATLADPDAGRARVAGHDVVREADQVRARIGLAGQYAAVDEKLTGRENLRMFGRLHHLPRAASRRRADELLERFGLAEAADRVAGTYSGGMRRRLDLIASLIVTPRVLFLDEPTTGLDPRSRGEIWDAVRALVADGTTVLLTTQYLDEADRLADDIVVIDHGRVIGQGTPDELKASLGTRIDVLLEDPSQRAAAARVLAALTGTTPDPPASGTTILDPAAGGSAVGPSSPGMVPEGPISGGSASHRPSSGGSAVGTAPTGPVPEGTASGGPASRHRTPDGPPSDGSASGGPSSGGPATGGPALDGTAADRLTAAAPSTLRLADVVRELDRAGVGIVDVALRRPTLDEVFLHLTGEPAPDETPGQGGEARDASHRTKKEKAA